MRLRDFVGWVSAARMLQFRFGADPRVTHRRWRSGIYAISEQFGRANPPYGVGKVAWPSCLLWGNGGTPMIYPDTMGS